MLLSVVAEGLQASLNELYTYCTQWKLYVNIDNTKIFIFHKGGRLKLNFEWVYKGNTIDVVNTLN